MRPYGYGGPDDARKRRPRPEPETPEQEVDDIVEMTFPASDPVSFGAVARQMAEQERNANDDDRKDRAAPPPSRE